MSRNYAETKTSSTKYWKSKPVMKLDEKIYTSEQINTIDETSRKYKKTEPTKLPTGYRWKKIDICDDSNMKDVSTFLSTHYRRGTESVYIIQYDPDRLRWEMNNSGYFLTVVDANDSIVGLIGFTYRTVQIFSDQHTMIEPMYMCCEKKYRKTGIAKVLMDETIRQSVTYGIDKGVFCDNRIVPKPIATFRQYSRPINYKKLRENDFVEIGGVEDEIVHNKTKINLKPNRRYVFAENNEQNIDLVYDLYNRYMDTFSFHMVLSKKDIENYLFNDKYARTYIIMSDPESDETEGNPGKRGSKESHPIDFVTYNYYDIINTENKTSDNVIKAANVLMYSSNEARPDVIFINLLKQLSFDKIHIVYIMDMMHSNKIILSNVKNADEDTDEEEENAVYDMNMIKSNKKIFLNLFNWKCNTFTQNMVSWLLF